MIPEARAAGIWESLWEDKMDTFREEFVDHDNDNRVEGVDVQKAICVLHLPKRFSRIEKVIQDDYDKAMSDIESHRTGETPKMVSLS